MGVVVVLWSVGVWSDHFNLRSSGSSPAEPSSLVAASSPFSSFGLPAYLSRRLSSWQSFVEVFYGVVVVGARALHELVEVARRVLLGLLARVISRGDQC